MEWAFVVVIAILVIQHLVREWQWHEKEIDLVDRALPRSDEEHKNQSFSHKIKGLGEGKRKRRKKKDDAKAGEGEKPSGASKLEW